MLFALFVDLIFTWVHQFLAGTPQQCDMPLCRPITVPPPPPWEIDHHTGTRSPTLYKQRVGSLTSHKLLICKGCEMGPMVYPPYLRRLESLTVFRCQRQHFLLSYLKTLSVGLARVLTNGLPLGRLALIQLT